MKLEHLESLFQSPGWRWFHALYQKEWGEAAFGLRIAAVYAALPPDKAGIAIPQAVVARQEIDKLFKAVDEKYSALKAEARREEVGMQPGRRPVGL